MKGIAKYGLEALILLMMPGIALMSQTVMDADSNIYRTVTIGKHVWMAENLKTTRFNDGSYIQQVPDSSVWTTISLPGYCWYSNTALYKDNFGALYNWHAVNSGKIAPMGWHVATDEEWTDLTDTLGGVAYAGGKLKETGTVEIGTGFWFNPNTGATNQSGFSARGGGARDLDGSFLYLFSHGYFWTSTTGEPGRAFYRLLSYNYGDVLKGDQKQQAGYSVRCVRDTGPGIEARQPGPFRIFTADKSLIINCGSAMQESIIAEIYDFVGKKVMESSIQCPHHVIDLTCMPGGPYIILISGKDRRWSYQFINR